jgi:hypothetical protein
MLRGSIGVPIFVVKATPRHRSPGSDRSANCTAGRASNTAMIGLGTRISRAEPSVFTGPGATESSAIP